MRATKNCFDGNKKLYYPSIGFAMNEQRTVLFCFEGNKKLLKGFVGVKVNVFRMYGMHQSIKKKIKPPHLCFQGKGIDILHHWAHQTLNQFRFHPLILPIPPPPLPLFRRIHILMHQNMYYLQKERIRQN